jgi:hypothetical protein
MFFKRKNSIDNSRLDILTSSIDNIINKEMCNVDKGLNECDSIAKIRDWQKKLDEVYQQHKQLRNNDAYTIIEKYISQHGDTYTYFSYSTGIKSHINSIIKQNLKLNRSNEEFFRDFGKEIDDYYTNYNNNEKRMDNLKKAIQEEKNKLGIK